MNDAVVRAQDAIAQLTSTWQGCPRITVVQSAGDLPFSAPMDTRGAYMPTTGQTFIIADSQPLSKVTDAVAHEVIGHHGLRIELGQHWSSFMGALQDGVRSGDWWLNEIRHDVRKAYVDDASRNYLHPLAEADELAAAATESRFDIKSGRMRVTAPIRARLSAACGHFRREVLYADVPVSFEQLLGTILAAEHRLRHGGQFFGLASRTKRWYAGPMSTFDPRKPPMSLSESEALLTAAKIEDQNEGSFLYSLFIWALLLSLVAIFAGAAFGWWGIFARIFGG